MTIRTGRHAPRARTGFRASSGLLVLAILLAALADQGADAPGTSARENPPVPGSRDQRLRPVTEQGLSAPGKASALRAAAHDIQPVAGMGVDELGLAGSRRKPLKLGGAAGGSKATPATKATPASRRPGARSGRPRRATPSGTIPGVHTSGHGPTAFQFKTILDLPLAATIVTPQGQPLPLARFSVVSALAPPAPGQALEDVTSSGSFFDGFSDAAGRVEATVSIPASVDDVDVVVLLANHSGAYTHENLRALWGPFAPASRITVSVGRLASMTIVLADL